MFLISPQDAQLSAPTGRLPAPDRTSEDRDRDRTSVGPDLWPSVVHIGNLMREIDWKY